MREFPPLLQVMAKDMILFAGKEVLDTTSRASVKTISVPVSSEMAPAFRIFVYHLTQTHEIISDVITIPVDGISRHKVRSGQVLWGGVLSLQRHPPHCHLFFDFQDCIYLLSALSVFFFN